MKPKIALAMIVKGSGKEPERLDKALSSIAPWIDGIFITLTGHSNEIKKAEEVCKKYKANISYKDATLVADEKMVKWLADFFGYAPHMKVGDKMFLFDVARNYNFSQVSEEYDWIVWMDCDDIFRGADKLHALAEMGEQRNIEAFYFNYLYQVDVQNGKIAQILIEHVRERMVRNNGHFKWIAPIHETLIEQVPTNKTDSNDCDVVHAADDADRRNSLTRNLNNLELSVFQSDGKDPRHIYYLAKAFYDIRTPEYDKKAIPLIHAYLYGEHKSGWPQERAEACVYLSDLYRRTNQLNNAVKACMNALIEGPQNPAIFVNLAQTYVHKKEWENALFWVKIASTIPLPHTTLVRNPRDVQAMIYEIIYNCAINMSKIDEAWKAANKMKELAPNDVQTINAFNFISSLREQRDMTLKIVELANHLKATGQWQKIKPLLAAAPNITIQTPYYQELYMKNNPPKYWNDKEIAIYCGPQFTLWSPKKYNDPKDTFIGGSEEAVICMGNALKKLGYKLTVYADPGDDEGDCDGVTYLPYWKFNRLDHFNIIIAWRNVSFFEQGLNVKQKYVWLHDIQNPLDYTKERIASVDKFFFLSKWHRDNVPQLPEDKVFITTNGI